MHTRKVFTCNDGYISSNKIDLEGFIPLDTNCPKELLNDPEIKGELLRPYVNGNDNTDVVYATMHERRSELATAGNI